VKIHQDQLFRCYILEIFRFGLVYLLQRLPELGYLQEIEKVNEQSQ
jgi:hypothetical protein